MEFHVENNIPDVMRYLNEAESSVLPLAHAKALTFTAEEVERDLVLTMNQVFDRPTRYTFNALQKERATVASQRASVFFKGGFGSQTPASNYLTPHVRGGGRAQKRSEKALQARGLMGNAGYTVAGQGSQLDAHGNLSGGKVKQILSQLKLSDPFQWETGKSKRRSTRRGADRHFVPRQGHPLAPGVYRREGRRAIPVLMFVDTVNYAKRFDFYGIANSTAKAVFPDKWASSLKREIARVRTPR